MNVCMGEFLFSFAQTAFIVQGSCSLQTDAAAAVQLAPAGAVGEALAELSRLAAAPLVAFSGGSRAQGATDRSIHPVRDVTALSNGPLADGRSGSAEGMR